MEFATDLRIGLGTRTRFLSGLGWDVAQESRFDLDMDMMAFCLDAMGKLPRGKADLIYSGAPKHDSGAVILLNDSLTGSGEGDDECMMLDLTKLPPNISRILFSVSIDGGNERHQDFSQSNNAFWRLVDAEAKQVLFQPLLSNPDWQGKTALLLATLERESMGWSLAPLFKPTLIADVDELISQYL